MELVSEKIKLQKEAIEESKKLNDAEIDKKKKDIQDSKDQIDKLKTDYSLITKHIDVLLNKVSDQKIVTGKSSKLVQLESKLETKLKKLDKEEKFYEENHDCPTCKQSIDDNFRRSQLSGINQTKGEIGVAIEDVEKQIEKANERIQEIQKVIAHIQEHRNELVKNESTSDAIHRYIKKTQKELDELTSRKDSSEEDNDKLKQLKEELTELLKVQEEISVNKHYYDYAASLLKDNGIKTKIIKQYLPNI
jgi:DNA repair exonuclease SbcCD ATPase subunit